MERVLANLRDLRWAAALALVSACLVGIFMLGNDVRARLKALERANSDNTQWVMMQTEVEILRLQTAVIEAQAVVARANLAGGGANSPALPPQDQARATAAALAEVRRWFDVIYSRVQTLEQSPLYVPLLRRPAYVTEHQALHKFVHDRVPLMDGPDSGLIAGLPALAQELPMVRASARSLTLRALSDFAEQSDIERNSMSDTLLRLALLTGGLIVLLAGFVLIVAGLYRTSRRQAEELRRTGGRLQTIIANSADAIVVTDSAGRVVEINPAAQDMFAITRQKALGSRAAALILAPVSDGQTASGPPIFDAAALRDGATIRSEITAKRSDGTTFPAEVSLAMSGRDSGHLIVGFFRDISERIRTQSDLTEARDRALAGEKAKARFLAVMSHEMRTPLNGLIGSLALLRNTPLSREQRRLVDILSLSGDILLGHVNTVLDSSRADAGAIVLQKSPFDLERLIDEVAENQRGLASAGGNEIRTECLSHPMGEVLGDVGRVRQILLNLVGNAVKFTQNGTITIESERIMGLPETGGGAMVELRVIDSGIGISDDDLDRIFEDFVTLDTNYDRAAGGTGLGLGITRRLVEAMGGEIGAESVLGEGSLFWVRLPLAPAGGSPADPGASIPHDRAIDADAQGGADDGGLDDGGMTDRVALPPHRILVVEDNEINRFLLRQMLVAEGHHVTEAVDGLDGVEQAQATRFDLILMDISMPRMDGLTATVTIRQGDGASAQVPIIALTAHALPEEQDRFFAAGMAACLTKPIGPAELTRALARVLADDRTARPAHAPDVVDVAALAQVRGQLGAARLAEFLTRAIREGDATLQTVTTLDPVAEADEIRRLCHQLSGVCGAFGTHALRFGLIRAETAAARGGGETLVHALAPLAAIWAETRAILLRESQMPIPDAPTPDAPTAPADR